jgi:hypothetical protein
MQRECADSKKKTNDLLEESGCMAEKAKRVDAELEHLKHASFSKQETAQDTIPISSPIHMLISYFNKLNGDSKKAMMTANVNSNTTTLKTELTTKESQAKLAKDLIKLADSYKIMEL